METDLEICFAEHISDTLMKRAPVGSLCTLGIQYTIGSIFPFSVILKPTRIVYFVLSSFISLQLLLALH